MKGLSFVLPYGTGVPARPSGKTCIAVLQFAENGEDQAAGWGGQHATGNAGPDGSTAHGLCGVCVAWDGEQRHRYTSRSKFGELAIKSITSPLRYLNVHVLRYL